MMKTCSDERLATLQSSGAGVSGPLAGEIAELGPWFHNLHLPDGSRTAPDHPLGDYPAFKWNALGPLLPTELHGARVLDIGCNAGFYSFELARRGAEVLAIDTDEHYLRQARWASRWLDERGRVEFQCMQVYDLPRLGERFDIVLFMGVFYHLRYPTLALDIVAETVKDVLVFQALSLRDGDPPRPQPQSVPYEEMEALNDPGWPKMAFVERELAGDPTNWWIPNHACVEALLRTSGFSVRARPGYEIYVCDRDRRIDTRAWDWRDQFEAVTAPQNGGATNVMVQSHPRQAEESK